MKFKKTPAAFSGDCTRQKQLNQSVDNLLARDRFLGDSEHRRNREIVLANRRKKVLGKIGRALTILILGGLYGAALALQF